MRYFLGKTLFNIPAVWVAKQIFEEAGMDRLLAKQYLLTGYLEYLMDHLDPSETEDKRFVEIITL